MDKNANLKLKEEGNYITAIENCDLIFIDGHLYDRKLNKKTSHIVRLAHEQFDGMENGMMKVYVNNKLGYIDSLANMKISPIYDAGDHFYDEGCTAVKKDGKWGFVRSNGEAITEMTYDEVSHFDSFNKCNYLLMKDSLYGCFFRRQGRV